jgi:S1-C subfamily serine protease
MAASEPTVSPASTLIPLMPVAATVARGSSLEATVAALSANTGVFGRGRRTSFNVAAATIRPSVVGIRATLNPSPGGRPALQRIGSGVAVDSGRYVVTCRHVIVGSSSISVTPFGTTNVQLAARTVAAEEDLALLELIEGSPLPAARFADSSRVMVGDWVLAVGHPFGLGLTVTAGIVGRRHSTLGIPGGQQYTGLLQTDAPINEGSSGGPLANLDGQVVGLNTAIYAPTGVFSGVGFAIPSNVIKDFLARHLRTFRAALTSRVATRRLG